MWVQALPARRNPIVRPWLCNRIEAPHALSLTLPSYKQLLELVIVTLQ